MTAAAPRTADPEARMGVMRARHQLFLARWWAAYGAPYPYLINGGGDATKFDLGVEAASIALDLARAALYDTPAHRERQLAIWAERERRALVRSVAW